MLEQIVILLIGFSVFSALLLVPIGLSSPSLPARQRGARVSGVLLMFGLILLQLGHARFLGGDAAVIGSPAYIALLYLVAPAFYLLLRGALQLPDSSGASQWVYFFPALIAPWLEPSWVLPFAFALGVGFAVHLGVLVFRLRAHQQRFRMELLAIAMHAGLAVIILALGLLSPWYGTRTYVLGYSIAIGLGFLLTLYIFLRFPDLPGKTAEAVSSTYAVSTLTRIDREQAISRIERLMDIERVYTNDSLSLTILSGMVELSPHQLSELINTHYGVGFSRYIRERRVDAARAALLAEPQASVLSIGLAAGFTSQSNFYAAFKEITGEVPGQFRKQRARKS